MPGMGSLQLSKGSFNVNSTDAKGRTALHWACDGGHVEVVEFLISAGTDPKLRDSFGFDAATYASICGHESCFYLLNSNDSQVYGNVLRICLDNESLALKSEELRELFREKVQIRQQEISGSYWVTQPFYQYADAVSAGPIEKLIVSETEAPLKAGLVWRSLAKNLSNHDLAVVHRMLMVSDDRNAIFPAFGFSISKEELRDEIARSPVFVGIDKTGGDLVGTVGSNYHEIQIRNSRIRCTEVHSLCVDGGHRKTKLAPLLINEMIRRSVKNEGIEFGIFTTSTGVLETPHLSLIRYFFRPLNAIRTIQTRFQSLPEYVTCTETVLHYKFDPVMNGFREFDCNDPEELKAVKSFLNSYPQLRGKELYRSFSEEDIILCYQPKFSYVQYSDAGKYVSAFFAFFPLRHGDEGENSVKSLKAAMLHTFAASDMKISAIPFLTTAKEKNFDVAIVPTCSGMEEDTLVDGGFQYMGECDLEIRMYNWKCPPISSERVFMYL